jgi:hypothetical protein
MGGEDKMTVVRTIGFCCTLLLFGCGGSQLEPQPAAAQQSSVSPETGEWLYATRNAGGGRRAECQKVHAVVLGEQKCKQALCRHGAELARDFSRVCKDLMPDAVAQIERIAKELAGRGSAAATLCEREARQLMSGRCEPAKCVETAQAWATRCAEEATPLVLRMIETNIERATGSEERVSLDARSCTALFGEVQQAAQCNQRFECEDQLGKVEEFRTRCVDRGVTRDLRQAAAELWIQFRAEQPVQPVPVDPGSKLTAKEAPLALEDGTGAVLAVCGQPVRDLPGYLAARRGCDGASVTFVRRIAASARLGNVPHQGDVLFRLRFPSLVVVGELPSRDKSELSAFLDLLDKAARGTAAGGATSERAIAQLVKAANLHLDGVMNSQLFAEEMKKRDDALVPIFAALGGAKKAKIVDTLPDSRFFASLNRARTLALADVGMDGRVDLAESTPAAVVDFHEVFPKAMAAYLDALAPRFELLQKLKAKTRIYDAIKESMRGHASACGEAQKAFRATERQALDCIFGETPCEEGRITELTAAIDAARVRADAEHLQARMALSSLPSDERKTAASEFAASGCRAPWW